MNSLSLATALIPETSALASIEGSLAVMIPIVAIIMPFLFVVSVLIIKTRKEAANRRLQHETMRILIEKGQPIPPELLVLPAEEPKKLRRDDRRTGLILIAVGVGLFFFFNGLRVTGAPDGMNFVGLIPGFIGVAFLINWFLSRKEKEEIGSK